MRTIYIADDGTEFDNYHECEYYEFTSKYPRVQNIVFLDINGNDVSDPMSEDGYSSVETIIVPDREAVDQLNEIGEYTGFCCYEDITSAGTWKFDNDPYDPRFIKISDER